MPNTHRYHGRLAAGLGIAGIFAGACLLLAGRGSGFVDAVRGISWWTLALAAGLHVVALVARSEAWTTSVRAAGSTLDRRRCYQVASFGFAANVMAPSLGTAVRIWMLRRLKAGSTPAASALVAAEVPVLAFQAAFCALMSVALAGRLGVPWWAPALAIVLAASALAVLPRVARRRTDGFWRGLEALGRRRERARLAACVAVIVATDLARSLLLLHAVGLPASVFDAMALRIATGVAATLPIGVGSGAGAAVLLFGAGAVGRAAAAGVVLTATGLAADLCFGAWGVGDLVWRGRRAAAGRLSTVVDVAAGFFCVCLIGFLAASAI
jgi:uncharacterized membrane protein YbhN (UPF0104 family)